MKDPADAEPARRDAYHHGRLREALVEAAVDVIAKHGVDKLSMREIARRAGVSPGAPFRHFADKTALLTAVAEQTTKRLRETVQAALETCAEEPAMVRFGAIGHAYLEWACQQPTEFRIVSERALVDYDGSDSLRADNEAIRAQMQSIFSEAFGADAVVSKKAQLAGRALVYGLARMSVDGHFPEWSLAGGATDQVVHETLDFFINLLVRVDAPPMAE